MKFMTGRPLNVGGMQCFVTRSGYTGEDGFEISVPGGDADNLARMLLAEHGGEADRPRRARLAAARSRPLPLRPRHRPRRRRRSKPTSPGRSASAAAPRAASPAPASSRTSSPNGPPRKRVGILPDGKAPARAHTEIADDIRRGHGRDHLAAASAPASSGPIAMGYVATPIAPRIGTPVNLMVRGKPLPAKVAAMPFVAAPLSPLTSSRRGDRP